MVAVCVTLVAFAACLFTGAADIPARSVIDAFTTPGSGNSAWDYIVLETRLPAASTALLCGMALSLAGLLMQTVFDNPLAGPSVLGISTGASLGVAVVMLAVGGSVTIWGRAAVLGSALAGAMAVMLLLIAVAALVRSAVMLLIVGMLLGYLASSAISLLNFFAPGESVHSYVIWGMGSFSGVTAAQLPLFAVLVIIPSIISFFFAKPLNAMLLGERYAASAGVDVAAVRRSLMLLSGALTAFATAWCGPVGFIGMVVPHMARLALRSSDHRSLIPATALMGAALGVICLLICVSPGDRGMIPLNAVTPVIGVPVIIYIIVRRRSIFYFN